jgi:hypothetical protein
MPCKKLLHVTCISAVHVAPLRAHVQMPWFACAACSCVVQHAPLHCTSAADLRFAACLIVVGVGCVPCVIDMDGRYGAVWSCHGTAYLR